MTRTLLDSERVLQGRQNKHKKCYVNRYFQKKKTISPKTKRENLSSSSLGTSVKWFSIHTYTLGLAGTLSICRRAAKMRLNRSYQISIVKPLWTRIVITNHYENIMPKCRELKQEISTRRYFMTHVTGYLKSSSGIKRKKLRV